jgi:hypothetical protein
MTYGKSEKDIFPEEKKPPLSRGSTNDLRSTKQGFTIGPINAA